jgi:hypothetical protein
MDRQAELDNTTSEIIEYEKGVFVIKGIYDYINTKSRHLDIASPYLNFRDALFHYKRMYEAAVDTDPARAADIELTIIEQRSSINEHLNRGIKDFAIQLCSNYYIPIIHRMIDALGDTMKIRLRRVYHGLKNLVVEIRLAGQRIARFDDADSEWLRRLVELVGAFHSLIAKDQTSYDCYIKTAQQLYPAERHFKGRGRVQSPRQTSAAEP